MRPARAPAPRSGRAVERRAWYVGALHLLQDPDPLVERRVGVERPVQPRALLALTVAVALTLASFERGLDPHLGGGPGGVVDDGLVVLELLERRDQPRRVASELDAARIGQQLPAPAHCELHEERDERRQDQEREGENHENDAGTSAVGAVAPVAAAEPHEAQP